MVLLVIAEVGGVIKSGLFAVFFPDKLSVFVGVAEGIVAMLVGSGALGGIVIILKLTDVEVVKFISLNTPVLPITITLLLMLVNCVKIVVVFPSMIIVIRIFRRISMVIIILLCDLELPLSSNSNSHVPTKSLAVLKSNLASIVLFSSMVTWIGFIVSFILSFQKKNE